jgi:hypothetical protein
MSDMRTVWHCGRLESAPQARPVLRLTAAIASAIRLAIDVNPIGRNLDLRWSIYQA